MRLSVLLALSVTTSAGLLCAQKNTLSSDEAKDGFILMFDGESLKGWVPEMKAEWRVEDGNIVGDGGDYGWLRYQKPFSDFVLKSDYRIAADGNSGIFLRSAQEGAPHETGYELQIFNQHPKYPTGSLVGAIVATPVSPTPDEWHSYVITAQGDHFLVELDGVPILDGHDAKSRSGFIGLQYNKGKKSEFRNLKVKSLGLRVK